MSRFAVIILLMSSFSCMSAMSQDISADSLEAAYAKFVGETKREYENFRKESNRKYALFFRKAWNWFTRKAPKEKPKEKDVPVVVFDDKNFKLQRIENKPIAIDEVIRPQFPTVKPIPVTPIDEKPLLNFGDAVEFTFYGTKGKVRFGNDLKFSLPRIDDKSLEEAWLLLSEDNYTNLIYDCLQLREDLQLSDWAYLNMLDAMAEACLGKGNEATFLMGYVLFQSGYRMRFARENYESLYLLYGSDHYIYGAGYFNVDGMRLYPYKCDINKISIAALNYEKECGVSLLLGKPQLFDYNPSDVRTLTSTRYPDVSAKVTVNRNLLDFYEGYPSSEMDNNMMTRWAIYANTPVDERTKEELYPTLERHVAGESQLEAVEKLLNWVQTAFEYEYDNKLWGHDRTFFAEESLFYPYCDCEDRAVLFSHLVRDMLGLNVILVYYPGHLASAVHFTEDVKGDYIEFDGKRYVVCDPTYIGVRVGSTMRNMDNATAKIILLQ